jgi:hypothetical protein
MLKRFAYPFCSLCFLLLAACSSNRHGLIKLNDDTVPIAIEFEAYWLDHGGLATFGPAIEPAFQDGAILRQTFMNVELVYRAEADSMEEVHLSPLGRYLGLAQPPVPRQKDDPSRYFNITGHTLHPRLEEIYYRLGGEDVLGLPIAEPTSRENRIEQYFENAGLFLDKKSGINNVGLLALGLESKPDRDSSTITGFTFVMPQRVILQPFSSFISTYGSEFVFGHPVGEPYLAADGSIEQVYERAILYFSETEDPAIKLRPIGYTFGPAGPPVADVEDPSGIYFQETGHNVRWAFAEFFRTHGGLEVLGLPLDEADLKGDRFRQRFENGILEYHFDLPAHLAVQLTPIELDDNYQSPVSEKSSFSPSRGGQGSTSIKPRQKSLTVISWVDHKLITVGTAQRIHILVAHTDGSPYVGIVPLISVYRPRAVIHPIVPATDERGRTEVSLYIYDLKPGENVRFEIAVVEDDSLGYAEGHFSARLSGR